MFKVNNKVNFEHTSHLVPMFLLLILKKYLPAGFGSINVNLDSLYATGLSIPPEKIRKPLLFYFQGEITST